MWWGGLAYGHDKAGGRGVLRQVSIVCGLIRPWVFSVCCSLQLFGTLAEWLIQLEV